MATWQLVVGTVLVLAPFALLTEFWRHRERQTVAGKPLDRPWRPKVAEPEPDDHH
jgi:hypothetical protein